MPHEEILDIKIRQGLKPSFNIKVSQLIVDIFKQCVDEIFIQVDLNFNNLPEPKNADDEEEYYYLLLDFVSK
ncbi:hypothetical protein C1645_818972 [Glomus cerebriforme]|uniref:Uncharacterized protein n=1 Tax=Glomus cerebriforme TaxID=658196 RepID=A0A397TA21_9GLOM|nr:hypothetical protein C1645_818972 [Glomus cerebriforme]